MLRDHPRGCWASCAPTAACKPPLRTLSRRCGAACDPASPRDARERVAPGPPRRPCRRLGAGAGAALGDALPTLRGARGSVLSPPLRSTADGAVGLGPGDLRLPGGRAAP